MSKATRAIERELFIEAEPDVVFDAFTQAEHIMAWFAPHARSAPGVGGFINLTWNSGETNKDCEILEWDPGSHVLMNWYAGPDGDTRLPVDVRLERRGGGTVLRLVHSGFLSDESWDDEYDSHGRGWSYELRSLKYYVERQLGRARQFVFRRIPLTGGAAALTGLIGPDCPFGADAAELAEGDRFTLRLPDGSSTAAEVMYELADKDFVAFADVLEGGLFRFAFETFAGAPELWIWAFSWQLAEKELEALVGPWFNEVEQRLRQLPETA